MTARAALTSHSCGARVKGFLRIAGRHQVTSCRHPPESSAIPCSGSDTMTDRPRVAIAHDYLTQRGGAERVVLALHRAFPEATIHTTLYDPDGTYPEFATPASSPRRLNRIGSAAPRAPRGAPPPAVCRVAPSHRRRRRRRIQPRAGRTGCRPPGASSSTATPRRGGSTRPDAYLGDEAGRSAKARSLGLLGGWLRRWDRRAAASADRYLANSTVVRERIAAAYGIEATVVPPPYGIDAGGAQNPGRPRSRTGPTTATCSSCRACCPTRTSTSPSRRCAYCPSDSSSSATARWRSSCGPRPPTTSAC